MWRVLLSSILDIVKQTFSSLCRPSSGVSELSLWVLEDGLELVGGNGVNAEEKVVFGSNEATVMN
jgi:hypothetical protein